MERPFFVHKKRVNLYVYSKSWGMFIPHKYGNIVVLTMKENVDVCECTVKGRVS